MLVISKLPVRQVMQGMLEKKPCKFSKLPVRQVIVWML